MVCHQLASFWNHKGEKDDWRRAKQAMGDGFLDEFRRRMGTDVVCHV